MKPQITKPIIAKNSNPGIKYAIKKILQKLTEFLKIQIINILFICHIFPLMFLFYDLVAYDYNILTIKK